MVICCGFFLVTNACILCGFGKKKKKKRLLNALNVNVIVHEIIIQITWNKAVAYRFSLQPTMTKQISIYLQNDEVSQNTYFYIAGIKKTN